MSIRKIAQKKKATTDAVTKFALFIYENYFFTSLAPLIWYDEPLMLNLVLEATSSKIILLPPLMVRVKSLPLYLEDLKEVSVPSAFRILSKSPVS